jgi:starch phosphorylase
VTPRRWLAFCNPGLTNLITGKIGDDWVTHLDQLQGLKKLADQAAFQKQWRAVKLENKKALTALVYERTGIRFDPAMMFDVQVKRIHEYKRQLLNVLHVIHLYDRIMKGDVENFTPRAVLIGGKAAPGYFIAKLMIKLVNNVAAVINAEPKTKGLLRVAFLPNYQVTAMEVICPATDLSEQISTAGKEASGTGNMKFMMNGAVTIGTLDGANIEIRDEVGEENFFLFGLSAEEVDEKRRNYDPAGIINSDPALAAVMHLLESNHFSRDGPGLFQPLTDSVSNPGDLWLTAADFASFVTAQEKAAQTYRDEVEWTRMSIVNTACSGFFSSDRTIREYGKDIWGLE